MTEEKDLATDIALREWAAEIVASEAPGEIPDRQRRSAWRGTILAIGAAAVVTVLLVVILGNRNGADAPVAQPVTTTTISVSPSAPSGFKVVEFGRLTIDVPEAWPMNSTRCGVAYEDTWIAGADALDCGVIGLPAGITYVQFHAYTSTSMSARLASSPTEEFTVPGLGEQAFLLDDSTPAVHSVEVVVPAFLVGVTIATNVDEELVATLLDSLRGSP